MDTLTPEQHARAVRMFKKPSRRPLTSVVACYEALAPLLVGHETERLVVLVLDRRLRPIKVETLTTGNSCFTVVCVRQILRAVLVNGGEAFVLAHNHPSGDPEPSADDIAVTRKCAEAAKVVGLNMLDHIIVGFVDEYTSLASRNIINP